MSPKAIMNSQLPQAPRHITHEQIYTVPDYGSLRGSQPSRLSHGLDMSVGTGHSKLCEDASGKTPGLEGSEQPGNPMMPLAKQRSQRDGYMRRNPLQAREQECHLNPSQRGPCRAPGPDSYLGLDGTWAVTLGQQPHPTLSSFPNRTGNKMAEVPSQPFGPEPGIFPYVPCPSKLSLAQPLINESKLRELRPVLAHEYTPPTNIDTSFSVNPGGSPDVPSIEDSYMFPPSAVWAGNIAHDTIDLPDTFNGLHVPAENWDDWNSSHFRCTPDSSFSSGCFTSDLSLGSVKAETPIVDDPYVHLDFEHPVDNPRSSWLGHISPACISEAASTPSSNMGAHDAGRQRRTSSKGASQRSRSKDAFLIQCKRAGMSYKDIKEKGSFSEAESTLRGRFRTLTKRKEHRVRKPGWQENDLRLLHEAVAKYIEPPRAVIPGEDMRTPKISWKQVGEYIWKNGGSYHFGNATCKKKWIQLQQHLGMV